jgi:hypothetical protein
MYSVSFLKRKEYQVKQNVESYKNFVLKGYPGRNLIVIWIIKPETVVLEVRAWFVVRGVS